MRRGILGGTFDPPHLAHLVAAEAAYRQLNLDLVTLLPAGAPWQKSDRPLTEARHRWQMTSLATQGIDYFEADDRELRRSDWTYTVDTLATFPPEEILVLVLGADAAARLPTWHRWREVLDRAEVAVARRPGSHRAEVEQVIGSHKWIEMPPLPLSGTALREQVAAGRSIRFLVPEPVWLYIGEQRLYERP